MNSMNKDPGSEGTALGYPWKGVVYIAIFLQEYWSVGARPGATTDKKHLELQLCKGNALKVVRANPGLGQGSAVL